MRLAEAAGMVREDIVAGTDRSLYASVRPHPWRRLKTKVSEHAIPLEADTLWAAQPVLDHKSPSPSLLLCEVGLSFLSQTFAGKSLIIVT
jgi:hypothetical protein